MASDQNENVEKLTKACNEAYYNYPTSCSHSVLYVIRQYKPEQPFMIANKLIDHLSVSPEWQEVRLSELSRLAASGSLIVGGAKEDGHGHVIVVYPGPEKKSGGFYYKDSKSGEMRIMGPKGVYARAMSTAMGSWPGAKSNGDKTVFDPWKAKDFKRVRFWKYVGPIKSKQ